MTSVFVMAVILAVVSLLWACSAPAGDMGIDSSFRSKRVLKQPPKIQPPQTATKPVVADPVVITVAPKVPPLFHSTITFKPTVFPKPPDLPYAVPVAPAVILYETRFDPELPRRGPHQIAGDPKFYEKFRDRVKTVVLSAIPDEKYDGLAVIDFESWHPLWMEPWHRPTTPGPWQEWMDYIAETRKDEVSKLDAAGLEKLWKATYEEVAQKFWTTWIVWCKELRPNAKWGFYDYPNTVQHGYGRTEPVFRFWGERNDRLAWLWKQVDFLAPSLYCINMSVPKGVTPGHGEIVEGAYDSVISSNMLECYRIGNGLPVYPFVWWRYHDHNPTHGEKFIDAYDLKTAMQLPFEYKAAGLILWDYISTKDQFDKTNDYIKESWNPVALDAQKLR